jgi:hypothetical protein
MVNSTLKQSDETE